MKDIKVEFTQLWKADLHQIAGARIKVATLGSCPTSIAIVIKNGGQGEGNLLEKWRACRKSIMLLLQNGDERVA